MSSMNGMASKSPSVAKNTRRSSPGPGLKPSNGSSRRPQTPNTTSKVPVNSTNGDSSPRSNSTTRREQVMRMREQKLREQEENLTFKPTIKRRAQRDSTEGPTSPDGTFNKLYEEARQRKEKSASLAAKIAPPFKPNISELAKSKGRASTPEATAARLYGTTGAGRPAPKDPPKQEAPTFRPQISKRGQALERGRDMSPATRLYAQAQASQARFEERKQRIDQEKVKDCTFAPKTNVGRSGSSGRVNSKTSTKKDPTENIATRMARYNELRQQKIESLKQARQAELSQSATFKPTSFTSKHKPRASTGGVPERQGSPTRESVFTRLSHATPKKQQEAREEDKELTFRPNLIAKRDVSPKPGDHAYENVHDRLYTEGTQRMRELEQEKEELRKELEKDLTFAPNVRRRNDGGEGVRDSLKGPVFERLSASRQYVDQILTQIKSEFEMDGCTFHPTINPTSEALAKHNSTPVHLRLASEAERLREENEKLRQKKLEEETKDCTFAPELSHAFTHRHNHGHAVFTKSESDTSVFERLARDAHRQSGNGDGTSTGEKWITSSTSLPPPPPAAAEIHLTPERANSLGTEAAVAPPAPPQLSEMDQEMY